MSPCRKIYLRRNKKNVFATEDYEDCLAIAICIRREGLEVECCFALIQIILISEECGWRKVARRWEMWEEIEVEPSRVK